MEPVRREFVTKVTLKRVCAMVLWNCFHHIPRQDLKGARTAMATSSGALSGSPARTTLAFAGALAVIPAFAGDAVALIERLTGPSIVFAARKQRRNGRCRTDTIQILFDRDVRLPAGSTRSRALRALRADFKRRSSKSSRAPLFPSK